MRELAFDRVVYYYYNNEMNELGEDNSIRTISLLSFVNKFKKEILGKYGKQKKLK